MSTCALLILDGFGIGKNDPKSNAIIAQGTPNIDALKEEYCSTAIGASGLDVGLPDGQMGNSEVGHTNIGAGRVVYQMLVKITKDIEDGVFFENKAMLAAMENCKKHDSALHLIGLVSPGGVHSHTEHLYGILEMAKRHGLKKVYVHALLDGRDVPPDSGVEYVAELVEKMKEIGVGKISDIFAGRGIGRSVRTHGNAEGMAAAQALLGEGSHGLCFINLVDFDMLYGHRQDVDGYAAAFAAFDRWLPGFLSAMRPDDALFITADHGCDPGDDSTDHSREYTPLLIAGKGIRPGSLGTRPTFADIGATVADCLGIAFRGDGESLWPQIAQEDDR